MLAAHSKEEALSKGELKRLLHYDPLTGVFTWVARRGPVAAGGLAGSTATSPRNKKYLRIKLGGRMWLAHRLAFRYMTGEWPVDQVDHDDGNGLNNAWLNLNEVDNQENARNSRLSSKNTSGAVGVSWDEAAGKWQAHIRAGGKQVRLGRFKDKTDAIAARKKASLTHEYHTNHGQVRPL